MVGDALETGYLVLLGEQGEDCVEYDEDQRELGVQLELGEVPDCDGDVRPPVLLPETRDHGLRCVDALHEDAGGGKWQAYAARAYAQLQRRATGS